MRNNTGFDDELRYIHGYGGMDVLSHTDDHDKAASEAGKGASEGRTPANTTGSGGGSPVSVIVWTVALIVLWAIFTRL
jgi:hypothetical protein